MDADPSFLPPGSYGVVWPLLGGLLLLPLRCLAPLVVRLPLALLLSLVRL